MNELTAAQKSILEDLLRSSTGEDGVDPLAFRASHFEQIEDIDYLAMTGFIRKDNERYFSSLTALIQLDSSRARRLLELSDLIFEALKTHYLKTQREPLPVKSLALSVGIDIPDVCEALSYMVEGPWWGARSTTFCNISDPYIQPAEQILRFARFSDVIQQLLSWQATRIQDRQLALAGALRSYGGEESERTQPSTGANRAKPDWFAELPDSSQSLLDETYSAWSFGLRSLTAMGIRAVIDDVCLDLVGDIGGFTKKIEALKGGGYISDLEASIITAAIDVGSASAHRGHVPNDSDIKVLFDIVEHILRAQYVLPKAVERLKTNTPARPSKPSL